MSDLDEGEAASREPVVAHKGADPIISPDHFRATLGHFCSGITIVTAVGDDGPAGLTCQSFASLSLEPPLILICPGQSSSSWPKVAATGAFCVNVLAENQEELCRGFAAKGGDKFAGIGWTPGPFTGSPVLNGALAWVECRIEATHAGGDHLIVVGRVLDLSASEGRPLLFFRGGYGRFDV